MRNVLTLVAAAGLASALALPASAASGQSHDGVRAKGQAVQHTDISSQHRRYHRNYSYRHRGYRVAPRYGYYRPYGGYRPYGYGYYGRPYYSPGISLGFYGGPRFGVWF